jgi:hypothetical protein
MVTEMALVAQYCTKLALDIEDTAAVRSAQAAAFGPLLARMKLGTASFHSAFPDQRRIVARDNHKSHSWAKWTVELVEFGSSQPGWSALVVAQSDLRAGKTPAVLDWW